MCVCVWGGGEAGDIIQILQVVLKVFIQHDVWKVTGFGIFDLKYLFTSVSVKLSPRLRSTALVADIINGTMQSSSTCYIHSFSMAKFSYFVYYLLKFPW
jgi:hypothetical protein